MDEKAKEIVIENHRSLFLKHGSSQQVGQGSPEGQGFRFEKLVQVGDLRNRQVLHVGCRIGELDPFLVERFGQVDYTGIGIVPELVAAGAQRHPGAPFICRDLLSDDFNETFEYYERCDSVVFAYPE